MSLIELLALYDNWNGTFVINNKECDLFARVRFEKINEWLHEYKTVACKEVLAFGFYDNELCIRVDI